MAKVSETYFRTAYGPKRRDVVLDFSLEPSLTKQSFKDECDINRIMARYQVTGMIDFVQKRVPQYLDCTGAEFQRSMDLVVQAQEMFQDLPSSVRDRFENDPAKFLSFCEDKENLPELRKMGLAIPEKAAEASPGAAGGAIAPAAVT